MVLKLTVAFLLMALCVSIHVVGMVSIVRSIQRRSARRVSRFWPATWQLVRVASLTLILHLVQIVAWASYYTWKQAMPDFATSAYFSAVTYTTTGYGDLVLPEEWRLVGGVEALTGILMCGLSTGMFFAVFSEIFGLKQKNAVHPHQTNTDQNA